MKKYIVEYRNKEKTMSKLELGLVIIVALGFLISLFGPRKKPRGRKARPKKLNYSKENNKNTFSRRTSKVSRSDEVILSSQLAELSGVEFERLLALYFRDHGYAVKEVGVGGSDGGVDLVITDKRGEKTAVQAKCYANHNPIPVQTVRELVAAKRNHDCILSLIVTTSDLTAPAKKEAEQFKVDYWHGRLVEQKLTTWGRWQPSKMKAKALGNAQKVNAQVISDKSLICVCGTPMVQRKGREGRIFWGCSNFPICRHTKAI
jgi:restriction system protein